MPKEPRKHVTPDTPEELIFDANLQEFATKVGFICGLESSGKIPPGDAYNRIKALWKGVKISRKNLHIGEDDEESGA